MQVKMIGVDHNLADLNIREKFSFTADEIRRGLTDIKENTRVRGAVIISTCNRTELWISEEEEKNTDLKKVLCDLKGLNKDDFSHVLIDRAGKEAIEHIMVTACGINSKVFGEDQILTQIRDALETSREVQCTSTTLEKVFLNAVTAGKKVKDSVKLTSHNPSVATSGIQELKEVYGSLKGKKCLIIGNGKMASLIAEHLIDNEASVYMTKRRRYHHMEEQKSIELPKCEMISYDDRYKYIPRVDIVISATLSPHNTITLEGLENIEVKEPSIWLDLAVPRDIDEKISQKYDITVWDIDSMKEDADEGNVAELSYAREIIGAYRDEMMKWLEFRRLVPIVNETLKNIRKDAFLRSEKELRALEMDDERKREVEKIVTDIAGRAMGKVLFGLKETLSEELWEQTIEAIFEASRKETIKS